MIDLEQTLVELVEKDGSDLHLKADRPPLMRKAGELKPMDDREPLSEEEIRRVLTDLLGQEQMDVLQEEYELDTSHHIEDVARFRVNVYHQMGKIGSVMRVIPLEVPTIEELGLPEKLKDFVLRPQGMVLVTGPTGSGKSTTLAAMIQHLNQESYKHVITIEDPIEYVYSDQKCAITQREVGQDTPNFQEALRRGLRQDPDVILVGEMRDRETIEIAIHAAETGHLVFSTLHTNDAKQTLDRILDSFPAEAQRQIRNMLSLSLEGVVSQRLLRRQDRSGMVAAMEIMDASPQVRDLIYEDNIDQIDSAISESQEYYGMQTFNQNLAELVQEGVVEKETAMKTSPDPGDLSLMLKGIQKGSGYVQDEGFGDEESEEDEEQASSAEHQKEGGEEEEDDIDINKGFSFD